MSRKYRIYGQVTGTKYLGVFEAASEEEAINKALESDAARVSVCNECSAEVEDPEIHSAIAEVESGGTR